MNLTGQFMYIQNRKMKKMKVKFKKLNQYAQTPFQATVGSAGFDLVATSKERISHNIVKYGTGIAVEIPKGYMGLVFARSSCYKAGMLLTNGVGLVDSDYRGEVTAVFATSNFSREYEVGDRVAQLVIVPYPAVEYVETDELSQTDRGTGGYGSTGR